MMDGSNDVDQLIAKCDDTKIAPTADKDGAKHVGEATQEVVVGGGLLYDHEVAQDLYPCDEAPPEATSGGN